jgi:hypothetical protein
MATKAQAIIQLVHADGEGKVLVETEQQDRFLLTVHAAIRACQKHLATWKRLRNSSRSCMASFPRGWQRRTNTCQKHL